MGEPRIPQTAADLQKQYDEQIEFLLASATAYDSGKLVEAKRLAIVLRILLYSKGQSKGLLQQLGKLNVSFWDTAFPYNPEVSPHYTGLIWTNARGDYRPLFDPTTHPTTRIPFEKWWETKPIIVAVPNESFTRKDIVRYVADQDGGAHVDSELSEKYAKLSRQNSLGRLHREGGESAPWQPYENPEFATIRQITHEVLKTLRVPNYAFQAKIPPGGSIGNVEAIFAYPPEWKKTGRNDPCPCGSGLKYKKCHLPKMP